MRYSAIIFWIIALSAGKGLEVLAQHPGSFRGHVGAGHQPDPPPPKPHNGFIVKISGDTLKGSILIDLRGNVSLKPEPADRYDVYNQILVATHSIRQIRVFDNGIKISGLKFTDFVKLPHKKRLFRVLSTGKISLYDKLLYSDEITGIDYTSLTLVKDSVVYSISQVKLESMIEHINTILSTNLTVSEFKGRGEIILWLRDHAND